MATITTARKGVNMRTEVSLNGSDWYIHQFKPGEGEKEGAHEAGCWYRWSWLKATVPGDIHSSLTDNGAIPDPHLADNTLQCRWVPDFEWWYRKTVPVTEDWGKGVCRLIFEGVDYDAEFWVDGKRIGGHEGMFTPVKLDITDIMKALLAKPVVPGHQGGGHQPNRDLLVAVRILPPPKDRRKVAGRKWGANYGMDWSPELITMGLWKGVKIVLTGELYLENIFVMPRLENGRGRIAVSVDCINASVVEKEADFQVRLSGKTFSSESLCTKEARTIAPGRHSVSFDIDIAEPKLWWPWDMGEPDLYQAEVSVACEGEVSDELQCSFGIREIRMLENPDTCAGGFPWTFTINGQKEFARGANWNSVDLLPQHLTQDRYSRLLTSARNANMNMLRMHGFDLIEKDEFYDLCDELGIMVWQDLPLGNANYSQDESFVASVANECAGSVRSIRNHASLVMWSGGNEYSYPLNKTLIDRLGKVCAENDPTRPFIPVSDLNQYYFPRKQGRVQARCGDYHNWEVWHRFAPIEQYAQDECLFASEFGLQAVPNIDSLVKFIPKDELWPPGPSWERRFAEMEKLNFYVTRLAGGEKIDNLAAFVAASQQAQAECLKYGIEHYRRRKYQTSGCLIFEFNEPWPLISWGIVDWYLQPKLAYQAVQNAFSPVLACIRYPKKEWTTGESFTADLWVINDFHRSIGGCSLTVDYVDGVGKRLERHDLGIDLRPDSAECVAQLSWTVPSECTEEFALRLFLATSDQVALSRNEYRFRIM
jgi:beta-mannosidase